MKCTNISDKTSQAIDVCVKKMFDLNRTADRMASLMQNEWAMPNASNIFHHKLAHLYPLLADSLTEIKDRWNLSTVYGATHEDGRTYSNLEDMFSTFLDENIEGYEMLKLACRVADEEQDFNVKADLIAFMQDYNKVIGQCITLHDKAEQMPTDFTRFDEYFDKFGIVGLD